MTVMSLKDSDLVQQERADQFLLNVLSKEPDAPHPANLAVAALRLVDLQLERWDHLPSGMPRRLIEDIASPSSARTCFASLKHLDKTTPCRVIK